MSKIDIIRKMRIKLRFRDIYVNLNIYRNSRYIITIKNRSVNIYFRGHASKRIREYIYNITLDVSKGEVCKI